MNNRQQLAFVYRKNSNPTIMKNNSIFSNAWCNQVFEGRNLNYGAYQLRQIAAQNTLYAFFISFCFITISLGLPFLLSLSHEEISVPEVGPIIVELFPPAENIEIKKPEASLPKSNPDNRQTLPVISTEDKPTPVPDEAVGSDVPAGFADSTGFFDDGQSAASNISSVDNDTNVYLSTGLEVEPLFPGGEPGLFEFYRRHIKYPADAYERNKTGTVYISFVITPDGKVKEVSILKGVDGVPSLGTEASRVTAMLPLWKPGMQNGKPVNVRLTVPVSYHIR
jgi:protein TonB